MIKSVLLSLIIITIIGSGCITKNNTDKIITPNSTQSKSLLQITKDEILFVGMIGKKPGLYKYEFTTKSYSEYWKNDKENIVELLYSPDYKSVFMLTASQLGKRGVFPFIDNVKLYFINLDSDSVEFLENIGSGLQVFSTWTSDSSFQVYLHAIDVTVAKYVEQIIKTFNASGEKISEEKINYYLEKEGYPQFPTVREKIISPNNKYSLLTIDSIQTQIYVSDNVNNKRILVTETNQKLNKIVWSNNEKLVVFSTMDISPGNETLYDPEPNTSKLFIYSLPDIKIVKFYDGSGIKNFLLNGDYLMFDNGFMEKSKIFIYSLKSQMVTDSITISGGCGLRNIPTIPDYEA